MFRKALCTSVAFIMAATPTLVSAEQINAYRAPAVPTLTNAPADSTEAAPPAPVASAPAPAQATGKSDSLLVEAIKNGKPLIDVRYRYEQKDQDGFSEDAYGNTIRTRFGYETGELYNFKVLVEFENVTSLGDDHFNSTTNGKGQFPVIADPDTTEVNRAQITFSGIEKTPITVGRQRFNLNNHRFVGAVDFRQNQQTFDAVRLSTTLIDNLTVDYVYISGVRRIFGDEHPKGSFDSDSHVISAAINGGALGTLKGYGVLLDLEEAPALSSATWGARYENKFTLNKEAKISLGIVGEYALQKEYADNPFDYSEDYIHGEATLAIASVAGKIGYEHLGGDGSIGFSTPLATLHKFQGFADVFLATPAAGIEDTYGTISYGTKNVAVVDSVRLFATYHEFQTASGSVELGDEFDAGITVKFQKHWSAELKGAVFNGDASGPADRNLLWASLRFQY